jgi:uncharacterized protein YcbX
MLVGQIRSIHRFPVKSMVGESLPSAEVGREGLLGDRAFALRDEQAGEIRGGKKLPRLMLCSARYLSEPTPSHVPQALITLPDGSETSTDDPAAARHLSALLGRAVRVCPLEPATNKEHYRRVLPGAGLAGVLSQFKPLHKLVMRAATLAGPSASDLRRDFGREQGEPLPDLSVFPLDTISYVAPLGTYFDAFPIHLVTTGSLAALRARQPASDWDPRRFRANFLIETPADRIEPVEAGWAGKILRCGEVELECTVPTPRCSMVTQAQPGLSKDTNLLRTIVREAQQNVGIYARVRKPGRVAAGAAVELVG